MSDPFEIFDLSTPLSSHHIPHQISHILTFIQNSLTEENHDIQPVTRDNLISINQLFHTLEILSKVESNIGLKLEISQRNLSINFFISTSMAEEE